MTAFVFFKEKRKNFTYFFKENKRIVYAFLAYNLVVAFSIVLNDQIIVGFGKLIYYNFTGFCICFIVYSLTDHHRYILQFVNFFFSVGLLCALHGISVRYFYFDPFFLKEYAHFSFALERYRVSSVMGNPVVYGTFLSLLFPFFFHKISLLGEGSKSYKVIFYAPLILWSIILSGSHSAYVGATLILLYVALFFSSSKSQIVSYLVKIPSLLFGTALLFIIADFFMSETSFHSVISMTKATFDLQHVSVASRLNNYLLTWEVLKDSPLLGVGLGNFDIAFEKFQKQEWQLPGGANTPDNQYLMVIIESGILGCIAFLVMLYYYLRQCKAFHNLLSRLPTKCLSLSVVCCLSTSTLLVMMTMWDALNHPSIRIYFWVIAGITLRIETTEKNI